MFIYIFIFLLFSSFFAFSFYSKRFSNPYRLYLVFGKKGSGKSTFLIRKAIYYLNRGWLVYTNMDDMCLPSVRHIDALKLGQFVPEQKSVLLLDEINLLWDNRDFKSFPKSTQKFFRLQRHHKVIVFCASQTYDCDKKIRDQTDMMYLCTCVSNVLSIARPIIKKPVITVSDSQSESRISEDLKMLPFWKWTVTLIPRYSKFYNSFSVDPVPQFEYVEDDPSTMSDFRRLKKAFKKYKNQTPI